MVKWHFFVTAAPETGKALTIFVKYPRSFVKYLISKYLRSFSKNNERLKAFDYILLSMFDRALTL